MTEYRTTTTEQTPAVRPTGARLAGRRFGRAALALAAVAGLGLAGAAAARAADGGATSGTASTPTCSPAALKTTFGRHLTGGMNHAGVVLTFRNLSGTTCALRGFPGVGLEDAAHRALPTHTHRGDTWYAGDPGTKTLLLKDGEAAEAILAWTHVDAGTSEAVHASYLEITPPAATTHRTLAFPEWVDNGDLHVTALARHIDVSG
ncbi:DUF4232 domain-containing protein [Streptomyces griseoaurantiacus]|uniref:DUF4232 domain-containing protein n=1 Tax=Streptomyces griseoaurantiacus TaxID=68213 RepID=A0A1G7Q6F6_9ACTN|nr:DUF4232 domain-containing protein [Streptomyces jietaisiensis]SDF94035.1 Protein of unknown function [Streptomyces jietaisiensis]